LWLFEYLHQLFWETSKESGEKPKAANEDICLPNQADQALELAQMLNQFHHRHISLSLQEKTAGKLRI